MSFLFHEFLGEKFSSLVGMIIKRKLILAYNDYGYQYLY